MSVRAETEPSLNFDEVEQHWRILSHENGASLITKEKSAEPVRWLARRENHSRRRDLRTYFNATLTAVTDLGQVPEPLGSSKIYGFIDVLADAVDLRHGSVDDNELAVLPLLTLDPNSDDDFFTDEIAHDVLSGMPGVKSCHSSIVNVDATDCFYLHVSNGDDSYDRFRIMRAEGANKEGEKELTYSLYIDTLRA